MSRGSEEGFEPVQLWLEKRKRKSTPQGMRGCFLISLQHRLQTWQRELLLRGTVNLSSVCFVFLLPSVTKPELKEHVGRRGVTVTQAGCYSHPRQNRQDNHRKNVTLWRETHLENLFHIMWRVKTPGMSWISGSEDVCIFFFCAAVVSNLSKDTILVWICVGSAPSRAA